MKKFLKWLILLPVAILATLFALANRHIVTVSFDPFTGNDIQGPQITAPLFITLFLAVMLGVLIGGVTTWFTQGRNRRAARLAKADVARVREEADRLKTQLALLSPPTSNAQAVAVRDAA